MSELVASETVGLRLARHGGGKRKSRSACRKAAAKGRCECSARSGRTIWPCCWIEVCRDCGLVIYAEPAR